VAGSLQATFEPAARARRMTMATLSTLIAMGWLLENVSG
jgi:hypothetical protein